VEAEVALHQTEQVADLAEALQLEVMDLALLEEQGRLVKETLEQIITFLQALINLEEAVVKALLQLH
jgi:hypothetical protein